ncbi:nucleotide exchange factor GrpE, partial [bacterium]|nr:nucleotide exchange factor GrpE [bacterium]
MIRRLFPEDSSQFNFLQNIFKSFDKEFIDRLEMFFPIIDNFNLAVNQTPENISSESWYKGIETIHRMLNKITSDLGLTAIPNDKLDSNLHEVISVIPGEKDVIIQTLEQGYI